MVVAAEQRAVGLTNEVLDYISIERDGLLEGQAVVGDDDVVGLGGRDLISVLAEHLQDAGSTVLDDPAHTVRQVDVNHGHLGVEERVGHSDYLAHVHLVVDRAIDTRHDHVAVVLLTGNVEGIARVLHDVKLIVTLMTVTTLVNIAIAGGTARAGDVIGIGEDVEVLVVGVERQDGAIVGNHLPHRDLTAITRAVQVTALHIVDPLVVTRDGHRAVLGEGHQIDVTRFLVVGIILQLPLATIAGQNIGILLFSLVQTGDGIVIKDVVNLVFAR